MSNNEDPEYVNQLGDLGIRTYILHSLMDKISRSKFEIKYLLLCTCKSFPYMLFDKHQTGPTRRIEC